VECFVMQITVYKCNIAESAKNFMYNYSAEYTNCHSAKCLKSRVEDRMTGRSFYIKPQLKHILIAVVCNL
jgi:hypothetical protein